MKITDCTISHPKDMFDVSHIGGSRVNVTYEDGTTAALLSYYPDELSFQASEFIGLTDDEGRKLFHDRDVAYLRS